MKKNIPNINFKPADDVNFGFEIVPVAKIANRKQTDDHNSQQPHQLKF